MKNRYGLAALLLASFAFLLTWQVTHSVGQEETPPTAKKPAETKVSAQVLDAGKGSRKKLPHPLQQKMLELVTITGQEDYLTQPLSLQETLQTMREIDKTFPPIFINDAAFKKANPDGEKVGEAVVQLRLPALKITRGKLLGLVLAQVPNRSIVFLVRPTYIEILPVEGAQPEMQGVQADFQGVPLEDALAELSFQTGIAVLLNPKAGDKAQQLVTARFPSETSLITAVGVLADMAGMTIMLVDNTCYVTLPSACNRIAFPQVNNPFAPNRAD